MPAMTAAAGSRRRDPALSSPAPGLPCAPAAVSTTPAAPIRPASAMRIGSMARILEARPENDKARPRGPGFAQAIRSGLLAVVELRHRLELILRRAQRGVVRIVLLGGRRGRRGRRGRAGRARSAAGRGAAGARGLARDRLVVELQIGPLHGDVVLAHAEEAADADGDLFDLAVLVEQQFLDVADLLVLRVIDIQADELR